MTETINTESDRNESVTGTILLAANIVAAYVSKNSLPAADLGSLLSKVHQTIAGLAGGGAVPLAATGQSEEIQKPTPAQVRKSITPDGIVSFIDGKSYKTIKRHLGTHGLDPHSYRQRFGLPIDYPMVAPNYAAKRSALAKSIGLGRPGSMAPASEPEQSTAPARKLRDRKAS